MWRPRAKPSAGRATTRVDVRTGIDWFELHGEVDYDGQTATLPQLLAAVRRGDTMVRLGDGTYGLLPEEWLERFAPLAGLGSKEEDHLRFRRNQAGLLDALLAAQPEVHVDELFERVRERMRTFNGVKSAPQPAGFVGQLRDYQCEGLGWMEFLREFGFGGCLADDMGVGKTAQVLAVLETRRTEGHGPSLVVAPKSLMFNWRAEAQRFTPQLRVLEHTGLARDTALIGRARSGADHLRHHAARRGAARGNGIRLRRAGRGAGRQELRPPRRPKRCACCAARIAWRSAARR